VPAEARVTVRAKGAAEVEAALDGGLLRPFAAPLTLRAGGHWLAARGRDALGYPGPLFWARLQATAERPRREELSDGTHRYSMDVYRLDLGEGTVTAVSWPVETPEPGNAWALQERDEVVVTAHGGEASAVIDGVTLGPGKAVTVRAMTPGRHALRIQAGAMAFDWALDVAAGGK